VLDPAQERHVKIAKERKTTRPNKKEKNTVSVERNVEELLALWHQTPETR
jgi:hypothetical protein